MPRSSAGVIVATLLVFSRPVAAHAQSHETARIELEIERANLSLDELRRLVPALGRVTLPEDVRFERLTASGSVSALRLDFALRSAASRIAGRLTGDFTGPMRRIDGSVTLHEVNLAQLLHRPALPIRFSGTTTLDLSIDTSGPVTAFDGSYDVNVSPR